jgi:hypothetical protein
VDEAVNRYARDLIEAINAAVAGDPAVRACRERARAAGVDLEVSIEAMVGVNGGTLPPRRSFEITAADRRFLRSLRIAAEETTEPAA